MAQECSLKAWVVDLEDEDDEQLESEDEDLEEGLESETGEFNDGLVYSIADNASISEHSEPTLDQLERDARDDRRILR